MSGSLISLSRTKQVHWHRYGGQDTVIIGAEAYQGHVLADGSWRQETLEARFRAWGPPRVFLKEQRLWRRFLERNGIPDFQLRFQMRSVRFYGTSARFVKLQPEWTIFLSLPNCRLGNLVVARTHFGVQPPSRAVMTDVRNLLQAPGHRDVLTGQTPIFIAGRLLIHFLSNALDYLINRKTRSGTWRVDADHSEKHGEPIPGDDENDDVVLEYPPLLPAQITFVPHHDTPRRYRWEAIHYEPDQNRLICRCVQSGEWGDLALSKPLYRCFNQLHFTGPSSRAVVKGVRYCLPGAVLHLNT